MNLLTGTTLDVSALSGALNAYGTLAFADDATIKLKFGGRKISSDMLVLTYVDANEEVAMPSNYGTLSFVRGDGGRMYSIYKRADGVFVGGGFTLFIK